MIETSLAKENLGVFAFGQVLSVWFLPYCGNAHLHEILGLQGR